MMGIGWMRNDGPLTLAIVPNAGTCGAVAVLVAGCAMKASRRWKAPPALCGNEPPALPRQQTRRFIGGLSVTNCVDT